MTCFLNQCNIGCLSSQQSEVDSTNQPTVARALGLRDTSGIKNWNGYFSPFWLNWQERILLKEISYILRPTTLFRLFIVAHTFIQSHSCLPCLRHGCPSFWSRGGWKYLPKMKLDFLCGHLSATLLVLLLLLQARNALSIPTPFNLTSETSLPLIKRSCFLSKQDTDDLPVCTTLSIEYFKELIADYNLLPQRDCLFYLGLGGATGQELGRQWYCQKRSFGRGSVA